MRDVLMSTRFFILQRDGFTCQYCGRSAPQVELNVDHIDPVCMGGDGAWENLVTACRDCNLGKGGNPLSRDAASRVKGVLTARESEDDFVASRRLERTADNVVDAADKTNSLEQSDVLLAESVDLAIAGSLEYGPPDFRSVRDEFNEWKNRLRLRAERANL